VHGFVVSPKTIRAVDRIRHLLAGARARQPTLEGP
jgi:hypothetical protein